MFRLRLPSPALVIACIAVFLAMGGVSYGLAAGSIDSREIKNNTIRSRDVRNGGLFGRDLKRGTVAGREVREAGLGTVPNADRVDGHHLGRLDWRAPAGTATSTILNFGGLILNATCSGGGDLSLTATTGANNSMVHIGTLHQLQDPPGNDPPDDSAYFDNNDLDVGESANALPGRDDRVKGTLTYLSPAGSIVDVSYLAQEQTNALASANDCFVVGKATQSG